MSIQTDRYPDLTGSLANLAVSMTMEAERADRRAADQRSQAESAAAAQAGPGGRGAAREIRAVAEQRAAEEAAEARAWRDVARAARDEGILVLGGHPKIDQLLQRDNPQLASAAVASGRVRYVSPDFSPAPGP
jgi:hypothetical protein